MIHKHINPAYSYVCIPLYYIPSFQGSHCFSPRVTKSGWFSMVPISWVKISVICSIWISHWWKSYSTTFFSPSYQHKVKGIQVCSSWKTMFKKKKKVFLILKSSTLRIPGNYFESLGLIHNCLTAFYELIEG